MLVIDHESQDETGAIARANGATVIERRFDGFVNARRFALTQVQTPWTLMIDADEVLDEYLRGAIAQASDGYDGYEVSRTTFYCGRALRMWRDEPLLRVFKTDRVRLEAAPAAGGEAQLHERWVCEGPTSLLAGSLLHYSYPTHAAYRAKFKSYTGIEAAGIRGSHAAWFAQAVLAPLRFLWYAFGRGAVLDGAAGIRVAWWSAWYPAAVQLRALRRD